MFWWGFAALALRNCLMYLCIQFSTSVYAYYNLFDLYVFRIWVRHIKYICMWSSCRPDRKRIAVKQILFSWRKKKAFHFHIFPKCTHRIRLPFRHQLNYITSTQINGSARQCQECANRITFEWTEVERNRDNRESESRRMRKERVSLEGKLNEFQHELSFRIYCVVCCFWSKSPSLYRLSIIPILCFPFHLFISFQCCLRTRRSVYMSACASARARVCLRVWVEFLLFHSLFE